MAYTLHNKVIFESVKTREQTLINDSSSQLSTLALSPDKKYLAVGEGRPASGSMGGNSYIYLYDTRTRKLLNRYTFH
jgi:Tol biopolymer transport system component